jgi:hypothetical protein
MLYLKKNTRVVIYNKLKILQQGKEKRSLSHYKISGDSSAPLLTSPIDYPYKLKCGELLLEYKL